MPSLIPIPLDEEAQVVVGHGGHDALMANAYLLYKRKREMLGKTVMSHYDFCKKFVLAKIYLCK